MQDEALDIRISVSRSEKNISMAVGRDWKNVGIGVDRGGPAYPEYEGPYVIDPTLYYQQLFDTYGKSMKDNLRVNPIQVASVSNPQGGRTITIGA